MSNNHRTRKKHMQPNHKKTAPITDEHNVDSTTLSIAFEKARQAPQPDGSPEKHEEKTAQEPVRHQTATEASPLQDEATPAGDIFRELIEARKASETRLKKQEETYASLLAIGSIGDSPEDIARQILYRRLVADGGTEKLQTALKLLDQQEAALLERLGLSPRENKQAAAPQTKAALPPEKTKRPPVFRTSGIPPKPAFRQGNIHELIQSAEAYFQLYRDEPGHAIRMQHLKQVFRDPARLNEFLAIHEPGDWARQFQYMYDNIIFPQSGYGEADDEKPAVSFGEENGGAAISIEERIRRNMDRMGL